MTFQVELKDGRKKDATKRRLGTSCLSCCFLTVFDPATIIGQPVRHDGTRIFWSRLQHQKCSHEVKGESVTVKVKACHDSSAEVTTGSVQRGCQNHKNCKILVVAIITPSLRRHQSASLLHPERTPPVETAAPAAEEDRRRS